MNPLAWLLVTLLLAAPAWAQDREQLERRVQSVATLIESSSAARQIESSGDAGAREKRDNARLIHREAVLTLQRGDVPAAAKLLNEATREMMSGARLAKPEQVAGAHAKREFTARMDSARALLAAQQRITIEKGNGAEATQATRSIEGLIADADKRAAAGRVDEARPLVDRAYHTARVSIEAMRRGDTLVRSLNFASPREEYEYEIDRNETHRMLIQVLLADRKDRMPGMQSFIDRAATLRGDAEAQARRGEHPAAIKTLEDSTRELVRAIRAGGVYIPG
jgi:ketosteroid isomerase-like protein